MSDQTSRTVIRSPVGDPLAMLIPSPMDSTPKVTYPEKGMKIPMLTTEPTLTYPEKGMEYPTLKIESKGFLTGPVEPNLNPTPLDSVLRLISMSEGTAKPKLNSPPRAFNIGINYSPNTVFPIFPNPTPNKPTTRVHPSPAPFTWVPPFDVSTSFRLPKALRKELRW